MDKLKMYGPKIVLLILGIIIYKFLARLIERFDSTGLVSLILTIGGWLLFIYVLLKLVFKDSAKIKQDNIAIKSSYENPQFLKRKIDHQEEKTGRNNLYFVYIAFFIFIFLLSNARVTLVNVSVGIPIARAFGGWFWGLFALCFIVGLGGMQLTRRFTGTTIHGTSVTGYMNDGVVEGTGGLPGAVALSLSYISMYIILTMITHWKFKEVFPPDGTNGTLVVMMIIAAFTVVPLYLLLVKMVRSNNKTVLIIGAIWLVFLSIIARL